MTHNHFNYLNVEDWIVLDQKVIFSYGKEEYPINIIKVKIGTYDAEEIKINNQYEKKTFDIIRWMPTSRYDNYLLEGGGAIIW